MVGCRRWARAALSAYRGCESMQFVSARYPIRDGASLFDATRHGFDAALFVVGFAGPVGRRSRRLCGAGIDAISKIAIAAANLDPVLGVGLQQ